MKHIVLAVLSTLLVTPAFASVHFTPSFFYSEVEEGGAKSELSIYNLKLGYKFANGFYFGGAFDMEDQDTVERSSFGAGIGYINKGWNFHFTYFITSTQEFGSNEFSGTGMNFEIGYLFNLNSNISMGPSLTYRSFEYDELDDVAFSPAHEHSRLLPYVTFQFAF